MTEDIKVTRLSKAAREFNVGISTIVEFLHKKGFDLDSNPNTKLPNEAYILLLKEYSTDISVKKESEKLILKDLHRKKESVSIEDFSEKSESDDVEKDEEVRITDTSAVKSTVDIKTEVKRPEVKLVGKIDLEKTLKPKVEKAAPPPAKEPEVKKPPVHAEPEKVEKKKTSAVNEAPVEVIPVGEEKIKSGIDLHIVGKIDLDKLKKTTPKPKKEEPKEETKPVSETPEEPVKEKVKAEVPEPVEEEPVSAGDIDTGEETEVVPEEVFVDDPLVPEEDVVALYKTDFKKLTGPRVVGRIDLPLEEKKKSTPYQPVRTGTDQDFRRKKRRKGFPRKRDNSCS